MIHLIYNSSRMLPICASSMEIFMNKGHTLSHLQEMESILSTGKRLCSSAKRLWKILNGGTVSWEVSRNFNVCKYHCFLLLLLWFALLSPCCSIPFSATNRSFALSKTAYDLYINSTFFFCPGGDSGPRKALFDGIALNSIPVVFEEVSFDVTYPVYFPGNPRDYTVFLNTSDDLMGQLRAVSSARITELQRNIARVRDSVSYIPNHDSFDATWMIMKQLEQYKLNGYNFFDRFPNKTTLNCVDKIEEFGGKCRLQA